MESQTFPETVAGGLDQRYFPDANAGAVVENFRYEPSGGWRNDRGWEPLIPYPTPWSIPLSEVTDLYQPCRFLSVIQRHQGGEEYYLQERNGVLFYEYGNVGTSALGNKVVLDKGRNIPRSDDPGTQAIPYGRLTAIINGYDKALAWWGRGLVYQFGFYQRPPAMTPLDVQTDYNQGTAFPPTGSPTDNNLSGIAVQFPPGSILGLGDPDGGSVNSYSYFRTDVTASGSESPMSTVSSTSWTVPTGSRAIDVANQKKYGVMLVGLDPGPTGTVARRIYRTKNKRDGISGAGDIFYLVAQIDDNNTTAYLDVTPDNQLTELAPSVADSVTISTSYKYGASWNGSFWMGGGESTPTRLIYSKAGKPEQFGAFDFFDVGVRDGGHITALYPYYDVLLVFRERSIDAVFTNASGTGYTCTTVKKDCGTTATNSIRLIPGYGVVFLNKDGFWIVKGGLRGGAEIQVENLTAKIEKEMGRLSKNALQRACASYSDREKEYWCIYPVDGQTECSRGAALNIVNGEWSTRGGTYESSTRQWDFTTIASDQSGYFILGTRPKYNSATPSLSNAYPGLGLQVWSGRPSWGDTIAVTVSPQGAYTLTPAAYPQGLSIWQSTWYDFGDDSIKKRVLSVELDVLTEGDNAIELLWAEDWGYTFTSAGTVFPQIGEVKGTAKEQATYSPAPVGVNLGNAATYDKSKWEEPRVTRLRWDVRTGLVSHFQFKVQSSNHMQIVRFQMNYVTGSVKTINTRAPGAKS